MNTHFTPLNEVTPQCVVALTWTLKDSLGEVLDELESPVEFLVGGDDLLPRIDEALQGYGKGARLNLNLEPADAFGDFDEQLIFLQPRHLLPADLQEGMLIEGAALPAEAAALMPADRLYTVTDIYPDHVVLDGNHPLAGISLRLALQVHAVREVTEEEVGRGSAGAGFFRIQTGPGPANEAGNETDAHRHPHAHGDDCGCGHVH